MKTPETTNQSKGDDPKASATLIVALVGALVVFVLIVILQAFFYQAEEGEHGRKVDQAVPEELAALRAKQQEALNSYRWVDQTHGVAAIPIDRAMELVVKEQGQTPPIEAPAPTARRPIGRPAEKKP